MEIISSVNRCDSYEHCPGVFLKGYEITCSNRKKIYITIPSHSKSDIVIQGTITNNDIIENLIGARILGIFYGQAFTSQVSNEIAPEWTRLAMYTSKLTVEFFSTDREESIDTIYKTW